MHARAQNFAKSADSLRMFYEFLLQTSRRGVGAAISAAASPASMQSVFSETEPETPEQGLA